MADNSDGSAAIAEALSPALTFEWNCVETKFMGFPPNTLRVFALWELRSTEADSNDDLPQTAHAPSAIALNGRRGLADQAQDACTELGRPVQIVSRPPTINAVP